MTRNFSRRGFLAIAVAASAAALGACSQHDGAEKDTNNNAADNTENKDQRVVVLNTGQLDNMLLLGILPVGAATAKGAELIPQFIRQEFGDRYDLDSIANCGLRQNPNIEAIGKLNPTLICANERTDESVLVKLRSIAPVVTGKGGGENWKDDLLTIADAVGKRDDAQQLLDDYLATAADFKAQLPQPAPTVSFLRTKDSSFQVYGPASMAGIVAADCGLARPESQQFTNEAGQDVSAEVLDKADADWIFYGVQDGAPSPTDSALWPSLKAVQAGHAVAVDYDAWYVNASLLSAQTIQDGMRTHILG